MMTHPKICRYCERLFDGSVRPQTWCVHCDTAYAYGWWAGVLASLVMAFFGAVMMQAVYLFFRP